jgi:hypothetical protein
VYLANWHSSGLSEWPLSTTWQPFKAGTINDRFVSTPVIENSEPKFRKGSKAVIGHGR